MRGSAVIGRALDLSIPVQFGAGEAVSSDCVTAQVFYAEARQSSVKVSVLPGEGALTGSVVRVQSATAINEPVVTLEVSATCGSSTRRSYVLLADFPPIAASQSSPDAAPAPPVVALPTAIIPESTGAPTSLNASRVGKTTPAAVKATPRKTSARPVHAATAAGASGQAVVRKAAAAVSTKPVLKLDPSDFFSDRIDLLDSTILLAPTEEALRQSSQITSLEGDVKSLRALAASNDARMSDLTAKLQQAQANQMPAWLTYAFTGLVVLLLACLAALLWLWLQLKRHGQQDPAQGWWQGAADQEKAPLTELLAPAVRTDAPAQPVPSAEPGGQLISVQAELTPAAPMAEVDIDFGSELLEAPLPGTFEVSTADAPLESNNIRHIIVESILDIRQQAEFFVSLGQTDRALLILNKQIAESAEPNPLVYLDLITLYHSLGMKAEFRELCSAFHQLFNGVIPDFSAFNLEGRDLEAYPEVLASLQGLWPGMDALVFLSACVFRDANAQHEGMFDLAAFRDLLMLHAQLETLLIELPAQTPELVMMAPVIPVIPVAQGLVAADDSPSRMSDFDFSSFTEPAPPHQKD